MSAVELRPCEIRGGQSENFVCAFQLAYLALEAFELLTLRREYLLGRAIVPILPILGASGKPGAIDRRAERAAEIAYSQSTPCFSAPLPAEIDASAFAGGPADFPLGVPGGDTAVVIALGEASSADAAGMDAATEGHLRHLDFPSLDPNAMTEVRCVEDNRATRTTPSRTSPALHATSAPAKSSVAVHLTTLPTPGSAS